MEKGETYEAVEDAPRLYVALNSGSALESANQLIRIMRRNEEHPVILNITVAIQDDGKFDGKAFAS